MTTSTAPARDDCPAAGAFVRVDDQDFYQISDYDCIPPFLMSIVSAGDHWMYVSSTGGLTIGRGSAESPFFPYQTVDKLHDSQLHTGPITLVRGHDAQGEPVFWRPFSNGIGGVPTGSRRLLKSLAGDQVVFEETHDRLGLVFRYSWRTSTEFGFIRTASLHNTGTTEIGVEVVDGLRNICPSGVSLYTYLRASCLADAYKHNECDPATGMGIFSLTAQILDRAEAAEVLKASTAWSSGLPEGVVFLSTEGLHAFAEGGTPGPETSCNGRRGNYFVYSPIALAPGQTRTWYMVGDVDRDHERVAWIRHQLLSGQPMEAALEDAALRNHRVLLRNVAGSDGIEATGGQLASAHHFANVLFNNMRGGVPAENYWVESHDFGAFINAWNRAVAKAEQAFLGALPERVEYTRLVADAERRGNPDLLRLAMEYLPLTFGRRHGDPSRPWNSFSIKMHHDDGSRIYGYEGNWRDIFQNWEALCTSFPALLPSIVAKFVNASTIDGFNPYRITRDGIDWEVADPEDPWSNIGYWGDHQIIYLSKLLEALHKYYPGDIKRLLEKQVFCYAQVPYRIKPFDEIAANHCDTIDFDTFTAKEIDRRVGELGSDGKLVCDGRGGIYHANLVEKLLVPVLAKLSNFVIDGGIWLNTQRPEWNDANNALVGSGLSMVTVCYLRRHLGLLIELLRESGANRFSVSVEVEQWFRSLISILQANRSLLRQPTVSDADRGRVLHELGRAFSDYRLKVYDDGFSGKHTVACSELIDFFWLSIEYLDHAIRANRRDDRLYHAYNLLELRSEDGSAAVANLYEMLEGQVAALSSGLLDAGQAIELVDAMFESRLYRPDQRSFMLYPDRELKGFLERNKIEPGHVDGVELLRRLVEAGDRSIVYRDLQGDYHFHHTIQKRADLEERLDRLALDPQWSELVATDRERVHDVFEAVFSHKTYTGRSGTMYGYEGLGCIYWHMVSKLLLAVQENALSAFDQQTSQSMVEALVDSYYLVRGGLCSDKTPGEYGAFPTDPYSHTPKHAGAQQPGMTGQVKEEILTRRGELGVRVLDGRVRFQPVLLRRREFLDAESDFSYINLSGEEKTITLPVGSLAFTVCQVPVVYRLSDGELSIKLTRADGQVIPADQDGLDTETSSSLFQRTGQVTRIDVDIPRQQIGRA